MSHSSTRSSRLVVIAAILLVLITGAAPRALSASDDPPSVVPFVGSAELGCTRDSGGPVCYGHHDYDAIDFLMPTGTPLVAPVDGFVTAVSSECGYHPSGCGHGYGNWVQISAADGTRNYLLAHMSEVYTTEGAVQAGDVVGLSGNSGASSTPHLHYEERSFGIEELDGDQVAPGSMAACLNEFVGWEYSGGEEGWYELPSHGGVIIRSNGASCFSAGARADVFGRNSLDRAGVLPDEKADRPGDWALSATHWLGERPVPDAVARPFDPTAREVFGNIQDDAIDFNTVWRMPPLR